METTTCNYISGSHLAAVISGYIAARVVHSANPPLRPGPGAITLDSRYFVKAAMVFATHVASAVRAGRQSILKMPTVVVGGNAATCSMQTSLDLIAEDLTDKVVKFASRHRANNRISTTISQEQKCKLKIGTSSPSSTTPHPGLHNNAQFLPRKLPKMIVALQPYRLCYWQPETPVRMQISMRYAVLFQKTYEAALIGKMTRLQCT